MRKRVFTTLFFFALLTYRLNLAKLGLYVIFWGNYAPIEFTQKRKKRSPGGWEGKVKIAADFDKLPKEFMEYFK